MRTDQKPFSDVRVRQAMSLAIDRQGIIDATAEGVGRVQPARCRPALKDWSIPMSQLGEGAKYYKHDPAEAKRLLAAAGYPQGFQGTMCFTTYGSTVLVDAMQLVLKNLKDVGIDAKLDQKEYGAYIASCFNGNFPSMTYGPQTPFLDPDNFLYAQYYPGEPKNQSHINDPVVADMLVRQRRTFDVAKRREIIYEIQRYLAKQQYYVQTPSGVVRGGVGRRPQELRSQRRLRLRRPPGGRLARPLSARGPSAAAREQWGGVGDGRGLGLPPTN